MLVLLTSSTFTFVMCMIALIQSGQLQEKKHKIPFTTFPTYNNGVSYYSGLHICLERKLLSLRGLVSINNRRHSVSILGYGGQKD